MAEPRVQKKGLQLASLMVPEMAELRAPKMVLQLASLMASKMAEPMAAHWVPQMAEPRVTKMVLQSVIRLAPLTDTAKAYQKGSTLGLRTALLMQMWKAAKKEICSESWK